jgi:thiol-disulfide isomerase/thioredoxin
MSSKAQRRSEAVAQKKAAADAVAARHRRNRWALWGGLAAVVLIAVVVAVASAGGDDTSNAKATSFETGQVTVDGTPLPQYNAIYAGNGKDPAIGETIPTLHGESVFDGKPVTVTPNGKPQAVVFVAHWCPHCQAEVPRLVALAKQGVFDGIDVTAVATGTSDQAPNYPPSAWLKRVQWPFPVMADSPTGTAANAFGISAYPYFVLVNADGKVAGRATGEVTDADVEANVKALKAGKPLPLLTSGASSSAS